MPATMPAPTGAENGRWRGRCRRRRRHRGAARENESQNDRRRASQCRMLPGCAIGPRQRPAPLRRRPPHARRPSGSAARASVRCWRGCSRRWRRRPARCPRPAASSVSIAWTKSRMLSRVIANRGLSTSDSAPVGREFGQLRPQRPRQRRRRRAQRREVIAGRRHPQRALVAIEPRPPRCCGIGAFAPLPVGPGHQQARRTGSSQSACPARWRRCPCRHRRRRATQPPSASASRAGSGTHR